MPASAGPPYVTDDPEPTDTGKWEVYGFATGTAFAHATEGISGFDINYGGARDLQLSAVVSAAYEHGAGEASHVGLSDLELGAKYRFLHQRAGSWLPDVSLFPKLEVPTANHRFGSGKAGVSIPLWAEKDFGPWSLFGGAGWTLDRGAGNRNYGFGGVALTRQAARNLTLGGEIYHQTADAIGSPTSTGVGFGVDWQVAPKWSIIGSGGPLIQHRSTAGDYAAYVALKFQD